MVDGESYRYISKIIAKPISANRRQELRMIVPLRDGGRGRGRL